MAKKGTFLYMIKYYGLPVLKDYEIRPFTNKEGTRIIGMVSNYTIADMELGKKYQKRFYFWKKLFGKCPDKFEFYNDSKGEKS